MPLAGRDTHNVAAQNIRYSGGMCPQKLVELNNKKLQQNLTSANRHITKSLAPNKRHEAPKNVINEQVLFTRRLGSGRSA